MATVALRGTRGPAPRHRDHRRRPAQRRLLRARARAAARQEDRQLRRARRLPPLLRRRGRTPGVDHDVLRVPGARAGPRRRGHGAHGLLARRLGEALDFWAAAARARGRRRRARRERALRFADPEGLDARARRRRRRRRAARRAAADDIPAEHAIQGFHGVRAYARDAGGDRAAARGARASTRRRPGAGGSPARERRGQLRPTTRRPTSRGIEGAGTVHHIAWNAADDAELEAWRERRRRGGRAPDADHRPPVLPLRLLPRARAACCSSSRRATSASTSTSRPSTLGEALKLPPQHEHLRDRLERTLTPIAQPARPGVTAVGAPLAASSARRRRARGRARPHARPRRRRARPLPAARPRSTRSGGCSASRPAARSSLPPGGRHWYVGPARRLPRPGDVRATATAR